MGLVNDNQLTLNLLMLDTRAEDQLIEEARGGVAKEVSRKDAEEEAKEEKAVQPQEQGHHHDAPQQQDQEPRLRKETKAVNPACLNRMPGPIVQAQQGGTCPRTLSNDPVTNPVSFEVQPAQSPRATDEGTWVRGATEEDNLRYKRFMVYMEERRIEARQRLQEEEALKEKARQKKKRWELLRISLEYLRLHDEKWQERRLEECERIKKEEKEDRLAIVRVKKRKYGLKRLSKDEGAKMRMRSEERILLATARENLWRMSRSPLEILDDEDEEAWGVVREGLLEFTAEDDWQGGRFKKEETPVIKNLVIVKESMLSDIKTEEVDTAKETVKTVKKSVMQSEDVLGVVKDVFGVEKNLVIVKESRLSDVKTEEVDTAKKETVKTVKKSVMQSEDVL